MLPIFTLQNEISHLASRPASCLVTSQSGGLFRKARERSYRIFGSLTPLDGLRRPAN